VIAERAERATLIVTTNLPFSEWTQVEKDSYAVGGAKGNGHGGAKSSCQKHPASVGARWIGCHRSCNAYCTTIVPTRRLGCWAANLVMLYCQGDKLVGETGFEPTTPWSPNPVLVCWLNSEGKTVYKIICADFGT
jgi:hypothetical protein